MQAIGIDIGTTSICGVAVDTVTGALIKSISKNSDAFIPGCAAWEKIQDVDKIITVAKSILDLLITEDTVCIGVTGQMHGIVYTDLAGLAVSPLYTWQDGRGDLPYEKTTYAKYMGSCTGYGAVTDFYNRVNRIRPEMAVSYCTIHDYFVMQLTGLKKPLVHITDAASFGCYDILSGKFTQDVPFDTIFDYAVAGTYKNIPVSVAIGDNQASVFSALADNAYGLFNVGTGAQISVVSNKPVAAENIETRPYFDGAYLLVGSSLCGGRAYSILKDFYKKAFSYFAELDDNAIYAIMDKMVQNAASSLDVDTRFAGTRADPLVRGSINGISADDFFPEELTKGVLNGMVTELFDMFNKMQSEITALICSGNGVRKNSHLRMLAKERFGVDVLLPAHLEEAAFGAALFGAVSSGILKNAQEAQKLIHYC